MKLFLPLMTAVISIIAMACGKFRPSMVLRTRQSVRVSGTSRRAVESSRTPRGYMASAAAALSTTGDRTCLGTSVSTVGNLDIAAASASA